MSTLPGTITEKVREILFRYRATPLACGKSPAELYLGRRLRIKLDALRHTNNKILKQAVKKYISRQLRVGERVQARWWAKNKTEWQFGTITKKLGHLHYEVRLDSGYTLKRHINQLRSTLVKLSERIETKEVKKKKKSVSFADDVDTPTTQLDLDIIYNNCQPNIVPESRNDPEDNPTIPTEQEANDSDTVPTAPVVRRSERTRRPPSYLKDYTK